MDVFAWSNKDMTCIDRDIAEHKIPLSKCNTSKTETPKDEVGIGLEKKEEVQ